MVSSFFMRMSSFVAVLFIALAIAPSVTYAGTRIDTNNDLEQRVRDYFWDIPVMIEIARCESQFTQYNKSGDPLHGGTGTMIGIFQISEVIHRKLAATFDWDINTPEGNMAYARYLYEQKGTLPWLDSKPCWNAPRSAARWKAATKALTEKTMVATTDQPADSNNASTTALTSIQVQLIDLLTKISDMQQVQQTPKVASVQQ